MSKQIIALLLLGCAAGAVLRGQTTNTGSLAGTVTDSTGAVAPGATIRATNSATGLVREGQSAASGAYRIDLLPAGIYDVKISMANFAMIVSENVGVAVNQSTTMDGVLTPGRQTESMTVEAAGTPSIDLENSDVRLLVDQQMVADLPLNGRDS